MKFILFLQTIQQCIGLLANLIWHSEPAAKQMIAASGIEIVIEICAFESSTSRCNSHDLDAFEQKCD